MSSDSDYIKNYIADRLYVNPGKNGAYASIASDSLNSDKERLVGEFEVSARTRVAVSAYYVSDKGDWNTLKITKLQFHKTHGWQSDGEIKLNQFDTSKLQEFMGVLAALDMSDAQKGRLDLGVLSIDQIGSVLRSSGAAGLLKSLENSPELERDIYAIGAKREALCEFKAMLEGSNDEQRWQRFFESNTWVFGYGLTFVFLDSVGDKLESVTTGSAFDRSGKRTDALLRTRAAVSQYALVEIKRADTKLLQANQYRPGCWGVSSEVSQAVTQLQKTVFDFSRSRFHDIPKNLAGDSLDDSIYSIEPRSYLVVGNQAQIRGNNDQIACFELYRKNITAPEIITFDELYERARFIVESLSTEPTSDDVDF